MQKISKLLFVFGLLLLATLGSAITASAMSDHDGGGHPGGHDGRRLSGVVTAVTDDTLTITKTHHLAEGGGITHPHQLVDHRPITGSLGITALINVNTTTVVQLVECQCTGTLSDVTVGDQIHVKGQRNDDGTTTALTVTVAPDGDKLGGAVTAVDGATLTIQARHGVTGSILTTADTRFFTKDGTATLADISVGSKIMAFGVKQSDGSLVARVVLLRGATPTSTGSTSGAIDAAAIDELVDVLVADSATQTVAVVTQLFLPLIKR